MRAVLGGEFSHAYECTLQPCAVGTFTPPLADSSHGGGRGVPVSLVLIEVPGSTVANMHGSREPLAAALLATGDLVLAVFDVASRASLAAAGKWVRRVADARTGAGIISPLVGVLVGSKSDLRAPPESGNSGIGGSGGSSSVKNADSHNRGTDYDRDAARTSVVDRRDSEELAATLGLGYCEVSALDSGSPPLRPFMLLAELARTRPRNSEPAVFAAASSALKTASIRA